MYCKIVKIDGRSEKEVASGHIESIPKVNDILKVSSLHILDNGSARSSVWNTSVIKNVMESDNGAVITTVSGSIYEIIKVDYGS